MSNSEILEALNSLRTHLESQFTATNSTIKACMQLVDSKFTDLLSTSPSPAPASSPAFRSGGSSSAPQQRRLPTAPVQRRGSSNSGIHLLSFDVTSLAAATTSAAASTSFSAAPPPFLSTTLYQTTDNADGKLRIIEDEGGKVALGSGISGSPLDSTFSKSVKQAPPAASGVNLTTLFEKAGCKTFTSLHRFWPLPPPPPPSSPPIEATPILAIRPPSASPPPTKAAPSCNKIVLGGGISFSQFQLLAHNTKVGQILENILWPNPLDKEAQSNPFNKYQDVAAVASRRGVIIFSLYALEEVYKDIFESPP